MKVLLAISFLIGSISDVFAESPVVAVSQQKIYTEATTQSAVVKNISIGDTLTVVHEFGDWRQVRTADGIAGWVHKDHIAPAFLEWTLHLPDVLPDQAQEIFEGRQEQANELFKQSEHFKYQSNIFNQINQWSAIFGKKHPPQNWRGDLKFYAHDESAHVTITSKEMNVTIEYKGIVQAGNPAYIQLSRLKSGIPVLFSGVFEFEKGLIKEESITQFGRMYNPAFRFQFTSMVEDVETIARKEKIQAQKTIEDSLRKKASEAPIQYGAIDEKPHPLRVITPEYPEKARRMRLEGRVMVKMLIDKEGRVEQVEAISGPKIFRKAALTVAQQMQFRPGRHAGERRKVWMIMPFEFSLK